MECPQLCAPPSACVSPTFTDVHELARATSAGREEAQGSRASDGRKRQYGVQEEADASAWAERSEGGENPGSGREDFRTNRALPAFLTVASLSAAGLRGVAPQKTGWISGNEVVQKRKIVFKIGTGSKALDAILGTATTTVPPRLPGVHALVVQVAASRAAV